MAPAVDRPDSRPFFESPSIDQTTGVTEQLQPGNELCISPGCNVGQSHRSAAQVSFCLLSDFASCPNLDKSVILAAYVNARICGRPSNSARAPAGGVALRVVGQEDYGCDGRQWGWLRGVRRRVFWSAWTEWGRQDDAG